MRAVPQTAGAADQKLGFSDAELLAFCTEHRVAAIAAAFGPRGDAERLGVIAWWGSAIADVAIDRQWADRDRVLAEAAAFNLAVALFDTVVESASGTAPLLFAALAPDRMLQRLRHPDADDHRIRCADPSLDLVASLFDTVLSRAGRRLARQPALLERLARQLEAMYLSELQRTPDAFVAKTGPVLLIGTLSGTGDADRTRLLYEAVAHLCHEWDDWQDMADDMRALEPNIFLGSPRRLFGLGAIPYAVRGMTRVLAGGLFHAGIAARLEARVRTAIARGSACDVQTHRKTLILCETLVG